MFFSSLDFKIDLLRAKNNSANVLATDFGNSGEPSGSTHAIAILH